MKRNKIVKILSSIIVLTLALGMFGCTESESTISDNTNKQEDNNANENINEDKENNESNTESENKNEENSNVSDEEINNEEEFILYTKNVNTEEKEVLATVKLNENLSLEEKLTSLAESLSKSAFSNLPLTLVEIKEIDGKKVAVFNFDEVGKNAEAETLWQDYEGKSWFNNYFQGSAGGGITEYTLKESLLQRDYTGQWIDGIEFTYKGGAMEFQHVEGLGSIIYR